MTQPLVWNAKRHDYPQDAVYIGRGTPWGNPFVISSGVLSPRITREDAIRKFEAEILPGLDIEPLRGKHLVCSCTPKNCHGLSIMKKLYPGIDTKICVPVYEDW